jgi:hypothetical protein
MMMAIQPRKASWIMAQRWFARDALDFTLGMRRDYGDLVHLPAPFGLAQYLVYHPITFTRFWLSTPINWKNRRLSKRLSGRLLARVCSLATGRCGNFNAN